MLAFCLTTIHCEDLRRPKFLRSQLLRLHDRQNMGIVLLDICDRGAHVLGEHVDRNAREQRLGTVEVAEAVDGSTLAPAVVEQLEPLKHLAEGLVEIVHGLAVSAAEDEVRRRGIAFGVIVANVGESDAIITAYQIDVFVVEEPVNIGIELKPRAFQEIRLESGQRHVFPTEIAGWLTPDPWLLLGRITYTDASRQITRLTGFARELDLNWSAYSVSKSHPESEYED